MGEGNQRERLSITGPSICGRHKFAEEHRSNAKGRGRERMEPALKQGMAVRIK